MTFLLCASYDDPSKRVIDASERVIGASERVIDASERVIGASGSVILSLSKDGRAII